MADIELNPEVKEWNRRTVADGNWLNANTIEPIKTHLRRLYENGLPKITEQDEGKALVVNEGDAVWGETAKLSAGIDLKIEDDVISVNTDGTIGNSAEMSFVAGSATYASGIGAAAFGYETVASGAEAHAEGYRAGAVGDASHAEGSYTSAVGSVSHAEGGSTSAVGPDSHAEGNYTNAVGPCSHAEGMGTRASGEYSHAEGSEASTVGSASHAEGGGTVASGNYSHAEGYYTSAGKAYAHSEGFSAVAGGKASHAEGSATIANDDCMHVGGLFNKTTDSAAFVIGNGNANTRSDAFVVYWDGIVSAKQFVESDPSLPITGGDFVTVTEDSTNNVLIVDLESTLGQMVTELSGVLSNRPATGHRYLLGLETDGSLGWFEVNQ